MFLQSALGQPLTQISAQYKVGNTVLWTGFTSTTKTKGVLGVFSPMEDDGTWASIGSKEGKQVVEFSLYNEDEVLFLPNSKFIVQEVLGVQTKKLIGVNLNRDVIHLTQVVPTPSVYNV